MAFTYSRSAEKSKQVVDFITAVGGEAIAIAADSAETGRYSAALAEAAARFGDIDILVNNAGVYISKDFVEHTIEDYETTMSVNVRVVFAASLAVVAHMKAGGRIITIGSSMANNAVSANTTLYTMNKSALQGFTRGLSRDLGPQKITVNLVQPGPIDTDMNPADSTQAVDLKSRMALGRIRQSRGYCRICKLPGRRRVGLYYRFNPND